MDLSKVMPAHIAISMFVGFFFASLGTYAARGIARSVADIYKALWLREKPTIPRFDRSEHKWKNADLTGKQKPEKEVSNV